MILCDARRFGRIRLFSKLSTLVGLCALSFAVGCNRGRTTGVSKYEATPSAGTGATQSTSTPTNGQPTLQTSQLGDQAIWDRADKAMQRKEYSAALNLLTPLAEQGDARAQSYLGLIYEKGYSVHRNFTEAVKWYSLAANQGEAEAQSNLGYLYERGLGVPKDMKEANRLFRLAANQNEGIAQYSLGVSYGTGDGIQRDDVQSYMWISLSRNGGWKPGEMDISQTNMIINTLTERMTKAQIIDAQRLAHDWKPKVNPVSCYILKKLCR